MGKFMKARAKNPVDALWARRDRGEREAQKAERVAAKVRNDEVDAVPRARRDDVAGGLMLLAALHRHHGRPPRDCDDSVSDTMPFNWRRQIPVLGSTGSPAAMCANLA